MLSYIRQSLRRKFARRFTREYPPIVNTFRLRNEGVVEFANWDNPLAPQTEITEGMVDFFRMFVNEGDLVIDIGANVGDTTVPMALAVGPSGMALGFEPNPYVFRILEKNASLNKDRYKIVPLPYAISTKEAEFYFISSEASFANGGISPTRASRHGKFIHPTKVRGIRLEDYLRKNHPTYREKLSFIKIDTEGYDKEILMSISDLIAECKPVIVAESFGASSDEAKKELFRVISAHDYDVYYFKDFDSRTETISVSCESEMLRWKKTINIFGRPRANSASTC
jgi:FkbM family methyltransferase